MSTTYYIKEKLFSFRDEYTIKTDEQTVVYYATEKILTVGKTLLLNDAQHRPQAKIKQNFSPIVPKFTANLSSGLDISVGKVLKLGGGYQISGISWNILSCYPSSEYKIQSAAQKDIARIQKIKLPLEDAYALTVYDPYDTLPCICITIALDACIAMLRKSGN